MELFGADNSRNVGFEFLTWRFYPANQPTQSGDARPARANEKATPYYEDKTIKKVIIVPKRMVNLIVA